MDKNKLRLLEDNSYRIRPCCAICAYSVFSNSAALFGTCSRLSYSHLKHSEKERQMSINRFGVCVNFFEPHDTKAKLLLGDFMRFVEK